MHAERTPWAGSGWLWRIALVVVVASTFLGTRAFAQPSPPAPPAAESSAPTTAAEPSPDEAAKKAEAKERFLRGLELAQKDSWDAALVEFQASREIFPTRAAMRNAGLSLRNLGRYAEALETYIELERTFASELTPDELKRNQEAIAELRAYVGELGVESDQAGATVVVDGRQYGTTPLAGPIVVGSGTHTLRVVKEGFETFEAQFAVAGKQKKSLRVAMKPLSKSGTLVVTEASGKILDVVVDGAVVGKTPFRGLVPVGKHSVLLRGEGELGSAPGSAAVREGETVTLALSATKLDSEMRVEPTPATASVDVDGVNVGAGIWQGRLTSGMHNVEVYAEGHVPFRKQVTLMSGGRQTVKVALDRDLSNPMWKVGFRPHIYLDVFGGPALAFSFGGGADASCGGTTRLPDGTSGEACSERSIPFGFLAGARGGYQLTSGLGIELMLGYLLMSESMTRTVAVEGDEADFGSRDYEDETKLSAPLGGIGVSYQFFEKTPLIVRLSGGVARAEVETGVTATFAGDVPHPENDAITATVSEKVTIPENEQSLWIPFVAPEVRFGYRVAKNIAVDLGIAAFLMFGPSSPREGGTFGDPTRRQVALTPIPEGYDVDLSPPMGNDDVNPGVLSMPKEDAVGTFVGLMPTVGVRVDF